MESLIKHFKASTSGFALPAEKPIVLQSAERRICVLMVSDGTARPYRVKIKSPDYASLRLTHSVEGIISPMLWPLSEV
jgi:NADH-quinone oxidoreductase subunit D